MPPADPAPCFANPNHLWASLLASTFARLGLRHAILCPGSRSTPLAFALAAQPEIEVLPQLDERSAAFFALGRARASHRPVAVVCTSGTAAANFLPAVIEAKESGVPLLVLTADRPPELRDTQASQTIDQVKLFGHYPRWQAELAVPEARAALLWHPRQVAQYAWERAQFPVPGPVHLNLPFREPLVPVEDPACRALEAGFDAAAYFAGLDAPPARLSVAEAGLAAEWARWQATGRGVIVAGPWDPRDAGRFTAAVDRVSRALGWPVLADALNPLRFGPDRPRAVVATYEFLLRHPPLARELRPGRVIVAGTMPTGKGLRTWIRDSGAEVVVVAPDDRAANPAETGVRPVRTDVGAFAPFAAGERAAARPEDDLICDSGPWLPPKWVDDPGPGGPAASDGRTSPWLARWQALDAAAEAELIRRLPAGEPLFEGTVAHHLLARLPAGTMLCVGNSMPPRDLEYFALRSRFAVRVLAQRGASGIDGTLSWALGAAHRGPPAVLYTGELGFLHDSNGLLAARQLQGSLTVVMINNHGGGIFGMLPVAAWEPPFERLFATPQEVDFALLCAAHGVRHEVVPSLATLGARLAEAPPGLRVLEVRTDRRHDATLRKALLREIGPAAAAASLFHP